MTELDLSQVDAVVERIGRRRRDVIAILHAIQECFGYLPEEALQRACEITDITPSDIMGVSTFYMHFRHRPVGRHMIRVCHGTACHIKGAQRVTDAVREHLNIPDDDDTDADRLFTVEKIACLGCCTLAPAVQIDELVYGYQSPETVENMLADFLEYARRRGSRARRRRKADGDGVQGEIRIGLGSCCVARGSGRVRWVGTLPAATLSCSTTPSARRAHA